MTDAFIVDGFRTPIGSFGGSLAAVRPDDMGALVISRLLARHPSLDPARITDVIFGCANQAGEDNRNVARMSLLLAGLPGVRSGDHGEPALRLRPERGRDGCVAAVRAGDGDVYVAGGVESMTRAPYALAKAGSPWARDAQIYDTSIGWRFVNPKMKELYGIDAMGETAENVADAFTVSREDQDRFARGVAAEGGDRARARALCDRDHAGHHTGRRKGSRSRVHRRTSSSSRTRRPRSWRACDRRSAATGREA